MKLVELYRFVVDNEYDEGFRECKYEEEEYSSEFILDDYRFSEHEDINNPKLVQRQVRIKDAHIYYDNIEVELIEDGMFNFLIRLTRNDLVIADILL